MISSDWDGWLGGMRRLEGLRALGACWLVWCTALFKLIVLVFLPYNTGIVGSLKIGTLRGLARLLLHLWCFIWIV